MTDEDWMRRLRDVSLELESEDAEQLDGMDERWERLARGELSSSERDELEAATANDAHLEAVFRAFEPLSADYQTRVADALHAQITDSTTPATNGEVAKLVSASSGDPESKRGWWDVLRAWWWAPALAGATAMAALFALPTPDFHPMPQYRLEVIGGDKVMRSPDRSSEGPIQVSAGSRIELRARPETGVEEELAAQLMLLGPDLKPLRWSPRVSSTPEGSWRIVSVVGADFPDTPGTYRVFVAIGRSSASPEREELLRAAGGDALPESWTMVSSTVEVLGQP
ncbi:MAG: hypothetical protein AAFZ38_06605 [Myxococcota bacterium]